MSYFYFSKESADNQCGTKVLRVNGAEGIHLGFALALDTETGALFQYNIVTGTKPATLKKPDLQLVKVTDDVTQCQLVLDTWGKIAPAGKDYCRDHGLPETAESLISHVKDFYQPQQQAATLVIDAKKIPKPPAPPKP